MHEIRTPWGRVLLAVTCSATVAMLPVFLLGATAPAVRADLGFDARHLGIAVSTFWVTMALGGLVGGRIAHAIGARPATYLGVGVAVVALAGLATAPSWPAVAGFAAVGGLSAALVTPAGDMATFAAVPTSRLGLAYGVKQAALPLAALLAGVGVPALVLTVGWRWTFVAAAAVAVPAVLALPRLPAPAAPDPATGAPRHGLLTGLIPVAVAVGFAMAAVSATGAFYVESAVAAGLPTPTAGVLLATGSACGIVGRFVFAWRSTARPLVVVAGLLLVGGLATTAFGAVPALGGTAMLAVATAAAFGAGWGWNGLLTQTVVAAHPHATARASAYVLVGAAIGGVLGPTLFGLVASGAGYPVAWSCCGAAFLVASAVLAGLAVRARRRQARTGAQERPMSSRILP